MEVIMAVSEYIRDSRCAADVGLRQCTCISLEAVYVFSTVRGPIGSDGWLEDLAASEVTPPDPNP